MDSKHTPTPWTVKFDHYIIPVAHQERSIGGCTNYNDHVEKFAHIIAQVEQDSKWRQQVEIRANAAFIVRAVNSHDQLVAALRHMTNEYVRTRAQQDGKKVGEDWSEYESIVCVEAARAALAAAEA